MKKFRAAAVLFFMFLLSFGTAAYAENDDSIVEQNAALPVTAAAAASTQITCGVMQNGTFGMMPEIHQYSVYLQGGKGIAFMANGSSIISLGLYTPSGTLVGVISPVASGSGSRYGVLTTPSGTSGYYTIRVNGACGDYSFNCLTGFSVTASAVNSTYQRGGAAEYARRYALTPNANWPAYTADCANFVSQCLHEGGGMPMIKGGGTDKYWYYNSASDRAPSWTGADSFMRHWTKVRLSSYNGRAATVRIYSKDYIINNKAAVGSLISVGDVVQYLRGSNSNAYHTTIISQKASSTDIKFCAHTTNRKDENWFDYIASSNISSTDWIIVIKISNS